MNLQILVVFEKSHFLEIFFKKMNKLRFFFMCFLIFLVRQLEWELVEMTGLDVITIPKWGLNFREK